jgi:hypothetical protein
MNLNFLNLRKIFSPRLFAGIIGLILITAAALKSYNVPMFAREIMAYKIITNNLLLTLSAWGLIIAEFVLGVSLLLYYRPRLIISLTGVLFVVFLFALVWALVTGVTENCGCFGAWIKRSPKGAIIEDLIMVAVLALSWPRRNQEFNARSRIKPLIVAIAVIAGIGLPMLFGTPQKDIIASITGKSAVKENQFALKDLEGVDLKNGTFLFVLISTDCSHCRESVEKFNQLTANAELPRIIALSSDSEDQRKAFIKELKPAFSVMGITENDFYKLLGTGLTPRTILVVKQHVIKMWDEEVPEADVIKEVLEK